MNEREAFAIIRNVLRLEGLARKIAVESNKELRQALRYVQEIVRNMPEGSIEREIFYQQTRDLIGNTFQTPSNRLQDDLTSGLVAESEQQAEWAATYVSRVADTSMKAAALNSLDKVRVLDKPLSQLFNGLAVVDARKVNQVVAKGFLEGWTNRQIAEAIGGLSKQLQTYNRAIARTAVMSMAQETHNAVWDANNDVIVGWEWDASMDFRVCPICAPLDGKRVKERSKLPSAPIHPNCRCMVLPRTTIEPPEGDRSIIELRKDKPAESANVRVYKNKVRGKDGKMYWKVVTDVGERDGKALTMGGFLRRANNVTQESVLGKARAKRFRELIKGTPGSRAPLSPEEALVRVTKT